MWFLQFLPVGYGFVGTVLLIETAVVIKNQVWISLSSLLDPTVLSVNLSKDWFATGEAPGE